MLIQMYICVWRVVVFASSLLAEEVVEVNMPCDGYFTLAAPSFSWLTIKPVLNAQPVLSGQLPIPKV